MGLDDYKKDKKYEVGKVSSRKSMSSISVKRSTWTNIIAAHPGTAESIAYDADEEEIKAIIELLDDAIQNELSGWDMSEDKINDFKRVREEIIDTHL